MANAQRVDPYRNCRFRVEIEGINVAGFQEVTLPVSETDVTDYREGNEKDTSVQKMPGLTKCSNLTLKNGVTDNMDLYNWRKQIVDSGAGKARKNISVILIDEEGNNKTRWDYLDAWPTKLEYSGLNAKGNEVQIQTIEIVVESLVRVS